MPAHIRALIRELSTANPLWGAPRIHGELQKLGITVNQTTVAPFMRRHPRPPSPTWRTVLTTHARQLIAADLFVHDHSSPGVFLISQALAVGRAVEELLSIWAASDHSEWTNQLTYLPL